METIIVDLPQIARGHDERFDGDERVDRLLIGVPPHPIEAHLRSWCTVQPRFAVS